MSKQSTPKELLTWDKKYLWHPFTQMRGWLEDPQVIIERGDGNYLYDIEGKKYLDAISSLWVTVHGHNHPYINEVVADQLNRISHSTLLGLGNVPSIELAKRLIEKAPRGLSKVFYSDNGSTAVEVALKMAFQYWQQRKPDHKIAQPQKKQRFISLREAYHGDTIGSVSVGGLDLFHRLYRPLLFDTLYIPSPHDIARSEGCSLEAAGEIALKEAGKVIQENKNEVAALIMEPLMQGAAGMLKQPAGFVRSLSRLCREAQVFLILDEVATGFGRTGKLFACEWEEITPDFLCLAKGISGGYLPLAATLTTEEIFSGFLGEFSELKTFFHGHTYTGNPLACAAGLASLDLFEAEGFWERLQVKIDFLTQGLETLKAHPNVGEIRQQGFMVGIEIVAKKNPRESLDFSKRTGHLICMAARPLGLMIRPLSDVLVLMPPLSLEKDEIRFMIKKVHEAIKGVMG